MRRLITAVAAITVAIIVVPAFAAPPQAIHYQGYLIDADGSPLNETVEMEFRLYEVEVAGEAFWETDGPLGVDVENGVFRVDLAPVTAEQFAGGEVWLGITVIPSDDEEPSAEMDPRLKVLSVPYALVADHAATADVAGEATSVTNVDFNIFATGNDVQDVLGVCIQEADLSAALEGYCASPCYGDTDVELFVTENGYVTLDALAVWAEENISIGLDEEALAAYLAGQGYLTEEEVIWFLSEAGFLKAEDLAGLGYVAGPHYTDGDVEALLDTKSYCQGPCFSGSYGDLADKPNLDGHDADTVDGFDTNATGQAIAQTIPVTDQDGKIPQELLPFNKGDLLAPADRQLVQGLDEYESGYFSIETLGIDGNLAANVKEGVEFGPGESLVGALKSAPKHDDFAWWDNPDTYIVYDDFEVSNIVDPARWSGTAGQMKVIQSDVAGGKSPELELTCGPSSNSGASAVLLPPNRHVFVRYYLAGGSAEAYGSISLNGAQRKQVGCGCGYCGCSHSGILVERAQSGKASLGLGCHGATNGSTVRIDDVRISRFNTATKSWLDCDDGSVCTHDYYGGESKEDCVHKPNALACDDNDACTLNDICGNGQCNGSAVNCDDGDAYTTDECDPGIGCINATCPVDVFDFSDGVDGWDLGAGGTWVWDESGWLQGFGSTATLKSPDFSGSSSKLRIRYKCKDGSGGLVFDPGPEMPCKSIGEWEQEYVDLGGATWKVHVAHKAPGAILLDRIEVLKECQ